MRLALTDGHSSRGPTSWVLTRDYGRWLLVGGGGVTGVSGCGGHNPAA